MASSLLSPGVYVKETDLTLTTPGVATSMGGIVGEFIWGPVNDITLVSNEATLVSRFGKPNNSTYKSFFTAKNFLDYSTSLQVVRVSMAGQLNAVSTGTAVKIANESAYTTGFINGEASVGITAAKYPGAIGNSLKVSIADAITFSRTLSGTVSGTAGSNIVNGNSTIFLTQVSVGSFVSITVNGSKITKQVTGLVSDTQITVDSNYDVSFNAGTLMTCDWEYASQFNAAPIDSNRAVALGATNDGLHAVVVDEDGKFTGTPGTVLERFENMSKARDALSFDGSSAYYKTVLNGSNYVWWMDHPDASGVTSAARSIATIAITNGGSGYSSAPSVSISGGGGSGATATATVTGGVVTAITITNAGVGYTTAPTVSFSGGGGSNAAATATLVTVIDTDFGQDIANGLAFKSLKKSITNSLTGGKDTDDLGTSATAGEYQLALDLFKPVDTVDLSLLMTGGVSKDVQRYAIQNIAEVRQDTVAFVSPYDISTNNPIVGDTAESLEKIIAWYNSVNVSSSFGVADSGYKYQYDKYNDVYRWVPLNGDIAGTCARTDSVAETWYSPAGLARGQIKNVTKLAYNPDKTARDELFKRNINPVVAFPGEGTVLFGDKTMTRRPSAFDGINVRRLFIFIEKAIAQASKYYLFEQNTDLTRQLFAATINPLLRDIKGKQGITDFYVDIGSNVNTPDTIDNGELRANIFIKPVRSIRFISLNFVATRTSANFTTIEL